MANEILIGRSAEDIEKFGAKGMGYVGKHFVGSKREAHMTNKILVDFARPHLIGLFGKRGQGKSYTMGTIAEEMLLAPPEVKDNMAIVMIDTMGIYWSMKMPNEKDFNLLSAWGLKPQPFDITVFVPGGLTAEYQKKGIPFDRTFYLKPSSLGFSDWSLTFNISLDTEVGILLETVIKKAKEQYDNYSIKDLIRITEKEDADQTAKRGMISRFMIADGWGIFSTDGADIFDIVKPGKMSVIDVSQLAGAGWSVKTLVVALLATEILDERIKARRLEEEEAISGTSGRKHMPITWMMIDEAHQFLPAEEVVASTKPLLDWVKIGREPGVSMVLATQMPNKLHPESISQSDVIISHRLTSRTDITALSNIMQTYLKYNMADYFDNMPREKGAPIILDDNSERIYEVRMRPRMSWHAGGSPIAIKEE